MKLLLLALALPSAAAPSEAGAPNSESVAPADAPEDDPECDRLFGGEQRRSDNEVERTQRLVMVRQGPSYIDIVQTGGWDNPEEMAIRGLEVLETAPDEGTAVLEVEEGLGFCEPGEYEVEVDDAVGAGGQILAVFDGLVLLQHDGALRYLREAGYGSRPLFKVSWQSRFAVIAPSKSTGGRSARSKARSRRRRRRN